MTYARGTSVSQEKTRVELEAVAVGVETEDEAFLAHVVMPDGKTVADHVLPQVENAYITGKVPALLPAGGTS